jgi:DNA-binding LytR/AlgR family response regulator
MALAGYMKQLGTSAEIVFVTAYNEHAIAAFDLSAPMCKLESITEVPDRFRLFESGSMSELVWSSEIHVVFQIKHIQAHRDRCS